MNQWLDESRRPRIIIDHHLNPELNADLLVSDPQACSTSEIVYCLLTQLGYDNLMTKECAMCIYCGMMTDTGGFIYNSSRPEIYYIISQLLEKGIDKDKIYRNVYNNYSVNRMRLMGYILNEKMVYLEEYKTSYFSITRDEMLRFHFKKGDAEGLVNLPLSIKGSILSVSLREDSEKELIRLSLRSVGGFPCNKMAAEYFNGGGHLNAAGGTLYCTMEEAIAIVNKAIKDYAPLLKDNKC
jgi:phosphoesterase RecJ-like protein